MSSFVQVVISQNELKLLGSVENEQPSHHLLSDRGRIMSQNARITEANNG